MSCDAREALLHHPCPGNIGGLQNAVERSLITSEGTLITSAHLALASSPVPAPAVAAPALDAPVHPAGSLDEHLDTLERKAILDALQRTHGHKPRAAALLGLSRFQFHTRLKLYGIEASPD